MESMKKYHELPTTWVRTWVGIGVTAIVLGILFLLVFGVYTEQELQRKADCDAGTRIDCEASLVWVLQGLDDVNIDSEAGQEALKEEASTKLAEEYKRGVRYYQTDEAAPSIRGVDVREASFDADWYSADAGSEVEIIVRPEGDFASVELYIHPKVSPTPGIGIHEGSFEEQEDGSYIASYRLPSNLEADLEARAVGEGDAYGSAFIQTRSK